MSQVKAKLAGAAAAVLFAALLFVCAAIAAECQAAGECERWFPDQPRPRPDWKPYRPDNRPDDRPPPDTRAPYQDRRTIYAERIILQGPDCRIVISASYRHPGLIVQNMRTGQAACINLVDSRKPIVGLITNRDRQQYLDAAMVVRRGKGFLQLRDNYGTHVMEAVEIANRPRGGVH